MGLEPAVIMHIGFNFAALRQVAAHEYVSRFVLGGAITILTGLLAKHYGPAVGGLFLAFPAIFPASATLLEKHEREKKQQAGIAYSHRGRLAAAIDARGASLAALALMLFALIVWRGLPRHSAPLVLGAALTAWAVLALLLWRGRQLLRFSLRRLRAPAGAARGK
jgi:hypothetical protein